jgi:hypothetical protein
MSVICSRDGAEASEWWLVKEGGQLPALCDKHTTLEGQGVWDSYLVMRFGLEGRKTRMVAPLAVDTVWKAKTIMEAYAEHVALAEQAFARAVRDFPRRVVPQRDGRPPGSRGLCVRVRLRSGMFGSVENCSCSVEDLFKGSEMCRSCSEARSEGAVQRFVSLDALRGLYPLGRTHWWKGVTLCGEV